MDLAEGQVIGREFRVGKTLGRDAISVVMMASEVRTSQPVVLRIFLEALSREALARFARIKQAHSDHLPKLFDIKTLEDGRSYFVSEYVEGTKLVDAVKRRPLTVVEVLDYVIQACDAIATAHAARTVHRRLKTSSLLLTKRGDHSLSVKVLAFDSGCSDATREAPDAEAMKNAQYRAPEQFAAPCRPDERCDIWTVGIILYELFTGQTPFATTNAQNIIKRILEEAPRRPSKLRPDIPEAVEQAILRCLEKAPDARWPHIADLALALGPFASKSSFDLARRMVRVTHSPRNQSSTMPPRFPSLKPGEIWTSDLASTNAEDEIGFRRMSKAGIEPLTAESAANAMRAKRVAAEASTLAREAISRAPAPSPSEEDDEGQPLLRALAPVDEAPAKPTPTAAASKQRQTLIILVLLVAVLLGLLVGAIVRVVGAGS